MNDLSLYIVSCVRRWTRTLFPQRYQAILASCAALTLVVGLVGLIVLSTQSPERPTHAAYRTIDEAFAGHVSQGWTLTMAPTDGKRYRICGATQSDPNSGVPSLGGAFESGGRSVVFDVQVADGTIVAVEGLDPIDGGPLAFAVLSRDLPQ